MAEKPGAGHCKGKLMWQCIIPFTFSSLIYISESISFTIWIPCNEKILLFFIVSLQKDKKRNVSTYKSEHFSQLSV